MFGECLQYEKESTNEVDKKAVPVARTNSHCKSKVVGNVPKYIFMIASMYPYPIGFCTSW